MLTGNEIYETTKYQIKGISWKLRTASTTNFQPSNVNIKTASHEKEEEKSETKKKKKKSKKKKKKKKRTELLCTILIFRI